MPLLLALLAVAAVAALVFGPQWWVRRTLARYSEPAQRYSGSGAELARHLLDLEGLQQVQVVRGGPNEDSYDPMAKVVRLSPLCHDSGSLTAITVAAHEVGHALQDRDGDARLIWRTRLAIAAHRAQQFSLILLIAAPILALALRSGVLMWLLVAGSLGIQALITVSQFATLPVEWDASFGRALPLLEKHAILHPADPPHAKRILRAAALTYVAASLFSLLLLLRWIR